MPGWQFAVVANVHSAHRQKDWESRLREPPQPSGRDPDGPERPVVSARRMRAAERAKRGVVDQEEQLLLREVFDLYDKDVSGQLDKKQLRNLMAVLNEGMYPTDTEVQDVMQRCDLSKTGGLDYEEFSAAITWWYQNTHPDDHVFSGATVHERRMLAAQKAQEVGTTEAGQLELEENARVEEVFKKYDKAGDGKISSSELAGMMKDMNGGVEPTQDEVAFVMWSSDLGQTGTLTLSEFKHAITYWYGQTHTVHAAEGDEMARSARAIDALNEQPDKEASRGGYGADGKKKDDHSACCTVS